MFAFRNGSSIVATSSHQAPCDPKGLMRSANILRVLLLLLV
jgi:hypothetical protein